MRRNSAVACSGLPAVPVFSGAHRVAALVLLPPRPGWCYNWGMTVNLNLDPEVLDAATKIASESGRSLGEVVSDLARKGLSPLPSASPATVTIEDRDGVAVAVVSPTPLPIDPEVVRRELEEHGP